MLGLSIFPKVLISNIFSFLNSTIDSRAVYNSAMSICFNKDPEFLRREVFWGDDLPNLTEELFKI